MLLLSGIVQATVPAMPAAPVSSVVTSQGRAVYVMLNYMGAGEGIPVIKARLEQDLHVIENVFQHYVARESGHKRLLLLIRATQHPVADPPVTEGGPVLPIATLSRTPAVALRYAYPSMGGPVGTRLDGGTARTENLGPAYVVETTTDRLSFSDLLAFVLLLPRLSEQTPVLAIDNEEIIRQVKDSREFQEFSRLELSLGHPGMWSTEGKSFSPVWQAGVLSYYVNDFVGNKLFKLEPLPYYLARPSWSPPVPRLIAGATATALMIVDTFSGKTHRLDLTAFFPAKYLQMSESIELTAAPQGERIYFTLSFNLPEEFWETEKHSYVYDLGSKEINIAPPAEPLAPKAQEQAPDRGAIREFVTPLPGYISPVHQLRGRGWPFGQLNRCESFLSPHWADLLPKDEPFVFLPAQFLEQNRFIAYASQEEIVVFDTVAQRYHRLDLKALRPADYQKISALRFAQKPNTSAANIYFFLEDRGRTMAAYLWDLPANKLLQLDTTLAELQRDGQEGWWEFAAGTVSFSLPPGTVILTGSEAGTVVIREFFAHLANVFVALSLWLGVFLFIFLLPYVLAGSLVLSAALKLKVSRLFFGLAPALTAVFFAGLSILTLRLILPYNERIEKLVYPLLWFPAGSAAGMIFMWGFIIAVTAVLTGLVFHQSRLLFRSLFKDPAGSTQESKSIAVSAGVVYGLAGAVLLMLLFLWAAVTLPYRLPADLQPLIFVAIFYLLCLAAASFLLRAPIVFAGYLTAAAAFLGIAVFGHYAVRFVGAVSGYSLSESAGQLIHGDWLGNFALILPQVLICLVYLTRIWLERRGRLLKTPKGLVVAALIAVPATVVIIFAERLHWDVPKLGYFALPAALLLIALTVVSFVAALIHLFRFSGQQPLPQAVPQSSLVPAAKKHKAPLGPIMTGMAALLALVFLMIEAETGALWIPGGYLGLLLLLFYLIVSAVYYFGRFLTVRLVKLFYRSS
jgi:hypothetical protein